MIHLQALLYLHIFLLNKPTPSIQIYFIYSAFQISRTGFLNVSNFLNWLVFWARYFFIVGLSCRMVECWAVSLACTCLMPVITPSLYARSFPPVVTSKHVSRQCKWPWGRGGGNALAETHISRLIWIWQFVSSCYTMVSSDISDSDFFFLSPCFQFSLTAMQIASSGITDIFCKSEIILK